MRKALLLFSISISVISCSTSKSTAPQQKTPTLKLLSTYEIPYNQDFKNTKIGGLSGIDYDIKNDLYYLLSDDRSQVNDSRFYTAKIHLDKNQIKNVEFVDTKTFKNKEGKNYGNWATTPTTAADPEDIRYNPKSNSLIWSNEGARIVTPDKLVLQKPSVNFIDLDGNHLGKVNSPVNLEMQKQGKGPRNNGTLEGITFDTNFKTIYTNIEEPLFEDGERATTQKGSYIRLYRFDAKTKKNTAQYAYKLDPIAHEPNPKEAFSVNGVAALLYFGNNQLLVVERSFSTGRPACTIKVYLCHLKKATNISSYASLRDENFEVAPKKLVLNMDDLGIFTDNIEGLTFGPKLANGQQSLLFVSDNNFSDKQKTQFLLFELRE